MSSRDRKHLVLSETALAEFVSQVQAKQEITAGVLHCNHLRHGWVFFMAKSLLLAIWHPSLVPGTPRDSVGAPKLFY